MLRGCGSFDILHVVCLEQTIVEQSEVEIGRLEACLAVAEESLSDEKASHAETQSELARSRVDLEASRRELLQQTSTLTAQLQVSPPLPSPACSAAPSCLFSGHQEREARLAELQSQVALVSAPPTATEGAELEGRLQELTESLIQRQTLVETLTSEKHSLAIQLEEMRRQQREGAGQGEGHQSSHSVVISGLEVETGEPHTPQADGNPSSHSATPAAGPSSQTHTMSAALSSVLRPDHNRWSRKMHSAANTLDSFKWVGLVVM